MSNPNQVVVSQVDSVTTVEITTQGPQGPAGAKGETGAEGEESLGEGCGVFLDEIYGCMDSMALF